MGELQQLKWSERGDDEGGKRRRSKRPNQSDAPGGPERWRGAKRRKQNTEGWDENSTRGRRDYRTGEEVGSWVRRLGEVLYWPQVFHSDLYLL